MKFTSALLALCAVQAAAFCPKPNAFARTSSLQSAPSGEGSPVFPVSVPAPAAASPAASGGDSLVKKMDSASQVLVQGSSLRTWSFQTPAIERVGVFLKTDGRPLNSNIELWMGPDYTPMKMDVYIEDGKLRPFSCIIETPGGDNAVAIRNTGQMEFPLAAAIEAEVEDETGTGTDRLDAVTKALSAKSVQKIVQGGAISTYPFAPSVQSVQILLETDGRPLNSRIELLQGPNNKKQVIDIYSSDGLKRPFFAVFESPGSGNVVRIINTATLEYPLLASVEPYLEDDFAADDSSDSYFIVD